MEVTLCVDAMERQPGGIGRYTWELCKGLAQSQEISRLLFFGRRRLIADPARLLGGERIRRGFGPVGLYRSLQARRALRSTLVHGPNYFLPAQAAAGVITVHDLSVFHYPETHPYARVRAFERLFTSSLNRASHIITDTDTVRNELVEMFTVRPESVSVVPLGVDGRFRPKDADELTPVLAQWGLVPGSYGLCVSTFEPRKKVAELIAAWRSLPVQMRCRYPLVLAGGSGWQNGELHEKVRRAVAEGWLRLLGFVDDRFLPHLYAGAALFIYPSMYEGFGLPPVEAMACGVPVIVSGRSCLPEVCGNAAYFIDPDDVPGLSAAIITGLSDSDWRAETIVRGLERAGLFTWSRCVADTVGVYTRASSATD